MNKIFSKLTVLFEEPFWIGIFECISDGDLSVCKVTFGAEPKDYEVYGFLLRNYLNLQFSSSEKVESKKAASNPKRLQREIKKELQSTGIGTKSQQALQRQREEMKIDHKHFSKEQKEVEKKRKFELKQQKRKEKHKGR